MLSETESLLTTPRSRKAVKAGDIDKAMQLVNEARARRFNQGEIGLY